MHRALDRHADAGSGKSTWEIDGNWMTKICKAPQDITTPACSLRVLRHLLVAQMYAVDFGFDLLSQQRPQLKEKVRLSFELCKSGFP